MKRILAGVAAAAAIALSASVASAAPFSGLGKADTGFNAGIIKVHGVHRECVEGRWGWHRSTPWGGRVACSPPRWNKWRHGGHGYGHNEGRGHRDVDVRPAPRHDAPAPRRIPRGSH